MVIEEVNIFDYEFLTGAWTGPPGAALWQTAEFCRNAGWGEYGKPTDKGQAAVDYFEKYVKNT